MHSKRKHGDAEKSTKPTKRTNTAVLVFFVLQNYKFMSKTIDFLFSIWYNIEKEKKKGEIKDVYMQ